MGKPSIILTSQFTIPNAKSYSNYVKYMTRKEALLEKEKALTVHEEEELMKIKNAIDHYDMEEGSSYLLSNPNGNLTEKEKEAQTILKSKKLFDTDIDFQKYISYMSRQYALEKKRKLSQVEKKELEVVKNKLNEFTKGNIEDTSNIAFEVKPGLFSINKEEMNVKDLEEVKNIIKKAQNNGSVFYQDVISFDTEFLIKEKLYDPETNELNEKRLQYASRKMMDKMFKDENINSGFWFASIHRNTMHIHIHFGTVEMKNTRKLVPIKQDGTEYLVPKGKRKQATIDNMKSTFANALIDRTAELSRISELRNTLVKEVKETYEKSSLKQSKLLNEIYQELPSNKKHWQYGSKYIKDETRKKIDTLTESLMTDNPNFQEYLKKIEEESRYRKELFGESERNEKNYADNKKKDIRKRLGNSLLAVMKNNINTVEQNRRVYKSMKYDGNTDLTRTSPNYKNIRKYPKPFIISRKNLYQIKRAINDDFAKYLAERDYEQLQQRIAWEQQKNRL